MFLMVNIGTHMISCFFVLLQSLILASHMVTARPKINIEETVSSDEELSEFVSDSWDSSSEPYSLTEMSEASGNSIHSSNKDVMDDSEESEEESSSDESDSGMSLETNSDFNDDEATDIPNEDVINMGTNSEIIKSSANERRRGQKKVNEDSDLAGKKRSETNGNPEQYENSGEEVTDSNEIEAFSDDYDEDSLGDRCRRDVFRIKRARRENSDVKKFLRHRRFQGTSRKLKHKHKIRRNDIPYFEKNKKDIVGDIILSFLKNSNSKEKRYNPKPYPFDPGDLRNSQNTNPMARNDAEALKSIENFFLKQSIHPVSHEDEILKKSPIEEFKRFQNNLHRYKTAIPEEKRQPQSREDKIDDNMSFSNKASSYYLVLQALNPTENIPVWKTSFKKRFKLNTNLSSPFPRQVTLSLPVLSTLWYGENKIITPSKNLHEPEITEKVSATSIRSINEENTPNSQRRSTSQLKISDSGISQNVSATSVHNIYEVSITNAQGSSPSQLKISDSKISQNVSTTTVHNIYEGSITNAQGSSTSQIESSDSEISQNVSTTSVRSIYEESVTNAQGSSASQMEISDSEISQNVFTSSIRSIHDENNPTTQGKRSPSLIKNISSSFINYSDDSVVLVIKIPLSVLKQTVRGKNGSQPKLQIEILSDNSNNTQYNSESTTSEDNFIYSKPFNTIKSEQRTSTTKRNVEMNNMAHEERNESNGIKQREEFLLMVKKFVWKAIQKRSNLNTHEKMLLYNEILQRVNHLMRKHKKHIPVE